MSLNDKISIFSHIKFFQKWINKGKAFYLKVTSHLLFQIHKPIIYAFGIIFVCAVVLALITKIGFFQYFVGLYLLLFGALEIRDIKDFKKIFEKYDPLSYWFPWYSGFYPYICILFGLCMVFDYFAFLVAIALVVMFSTQGYGIWKIMRKGPPTPHINMGPRYKIPLSKLILLESGIIVLFSLSILF